MKPRVEILLVDDNPNNLLALDATLSDLGETLVKASSGTEALKLVLERDYALIILDVQMPDMDGFECAQLIRSRERSKRIPIIFLTAFSRTDEAVKHAYQLGAVDFLFKPIVPEVLRSKVSVFVDLHRKTEEVRRQADLLRAAEKNEHQRRLDEEKRRWEAELLRKEIEVERRQKDELTRNIEDRIRAEQGLIAANSRLTLLAEAANRLLVDTRPQAFLSSLFGNLSAHLGLEIYFHHLLEPGGQTLRLDTYVGVDDETAARRYRVPLGEGIAGRVALSRAPIVLEDIMESTDPSAEPMRAMGATALACYPLIADGRLFGTLALGTRRRAKFQVDELQVMQVLSDQVAMALERARLIGELKSRADALAEADRRKDEFLAMLAHELRNPLAPIMTALKVLEVGGDPARDARARAAMGRQVHQMVRLVDDLLDVSRVTAGKIELRRARVPLAGVMQQAVQTSMPVIEARKHTLTASYPDESVTVLVDPARLSQIISNLLNNAAKYTDNGGKIELAYAVAGDELMLSVADNGRGIRPDMLPKVFDLFVQSDRNADLSMGGLGVGLTLVRRLCEMHGGSVTAESEGDQKGSTFTVRMPVVVNASDPVPDAIILDPVSGRLDGGLKVLVIDDNADIRATLHDLLEMLGHTVSVAEDGPRGIEAVRSSAPHVALIDIGLPGIDGYDVARRLRADAVGRDTRTRLIALTGYGQAEDKRRALEAGFDAHLVKPVDPEDLSRLLREQAVTA